MISAIAQPAIPAWIASAVSQEADADVPLKELLRDSLYYPACGLNGTPVKYLAGNVHSFVYVDYGIRLPEYLAEVHGEGRRQGFFGYRPVLGKEVNLDKLIPSDWKPGLIPRNPYELNILGTRLRNCTPFGHWTVWKRREEFPPEHGPELFSLLFVAGEMSFVYQGLYCRNGVRPKVLSIIQPGSFGGEWENTSGNDSFFKSVVLSNPAGMPEFLLNGGMGRDSHEFPCWREYRGERLARLPERDAGLWALNPAEIRHELRFRTSPTENPAWHSGNALTLRARAIGNKHDETRAEPGLALPSLFEKVEAWI